MSRAFLNSSWLNPSKSGSADVLEALGININLWWGLVLLAFGLVMLGFSTLTKEGLTGAGMQMFSHGVMTALFFAVVGMVYDRAHTREIPKLGGFAKVMPLVAVAFMTKAEKRRARELAQEELG